MGEAGHDPCYEVVAKLASRIPDVVVLGPFSIRACFHVEILAVRVQLAYQKTDETNLSWVLDVPAGDGVVVRSEAALVVLGAVLSSELDDFDASDSGEAKVSCFDAFLHFLGPESEVVCDKELNRFRQNSGIALRLVVKVRQAQLQILLR